MVSTEYDFTTVSLTPSAKNFRLHQPSKDPAQELN
jgi:hypothetical protein